VFQEHAQIEGRHRLRITVDGIRQNQLDRADFEVALELATSFDFLYQNGILTRGACWCETV